jgi:hypothetical protein
VSGRERANYCWDVVLLLVLVLVLDPFGSGLDKLYFSRTRNNLPIISGVWLTVLACDCLFEMIKVPTLIDRWILESASG